MSVKPQQFHPHRLSKADKYWRAADKYSTTIAVPRPSSSQRGYGREWYRIRNEYIALNPNCAMCGAKAQEVDHIHPLSLGGTSEPVNLQSLCKRCHGFKTATSDKPRIAINRGRGG